MRTVEDSIKAAERLGLEIGGFLRRSSSGWECSIRYKRDKVFFHGTSSGMTLAEAAHNALKCRLVNLLDTKQVIEASSLRRDVNVEDML